ncbi:MAG: amidohydrolase [Proteobacteria bacterium]|nr:amidohydrolase [Pseudomonadota bacterium]
MKQIIQKILPRYQTIRQQLHRYPELRYQEVNTAKLIQQALMDMGFNPQIQIGKTGVVAVLDSGKPGKTVALRADMDALPIEEETDLDYISQNKGLMHACGHDGHVATLLGVAEVLQQLRHTFTGKVKFIFQPAEEGGAGALAMIKDGVLENPVVDAIFGYHNHPGTAVGKVLVKHGTTMYGNAEFSIQVHGKGGHAAMPEWAINPITLSALVITALQTVSDALAKDPETTVLSVTTLHSGKAKNVIPEYAIIGGTIRAPSEKATMHAQKLIEAELNKVTQGSGCTFTITYEDIYPATINTPVETDFVLKQAKLLLGENNVAIKAKSGRASEDFSYFLQKVPGCYFFIGNGEDSASCHSPHYNFNDGILPVAIELLATIAITYLQNE